MGGCGDWSKRVERALTDARKDNDFIYHERIPDVKTLASIGRAAVVKPTVLPDKFLPQEKELFAALMPVHIHQVRYCCRSIASPVLHSIAPPVVHSIAPPVVHSIASPGRGSL